jgi:hypothetical protein
MRFRGLITGLLLGLGAAAAWTSEAQARSLLYRDAATGRWIAIAAEGDVVSSGAFMNRNLGSFL